MSIMSRSIAAVLLVAALALGGQELAAPRACADCPEFTPACGPFVSPLGGNIQWDPTTLQKLQEEFVIESSAYSPENRRYTWVLRTRRSFPGTHEEAEKKLGEVVLATYGKDIGWCVYFYNDEGRKVGVGEIFITTGERRPDNTFVLFADLSLLNADLIATRGLVTLCEQKPYQWEEEGKGAKRPKDEKNGKKKDEKNGKKKDEKNGKKKGEKDGL
jgi:hypothetical protein